MYFYVVAVPGFHVKHATIICCGQYSNTWKPSLLICLSQSICYKQDVHARMNACTSYAMQRVQFISAEQHAPVDVDLPAGLAGNPPKPPAGLAGKAGKVGAAAGTELWAAGAAACVAGCALACSAGLRAGKPPKPPANPRGGRPGKPPAGLAGVGGAAG
jgi:hypothetical protein